MADIHQLWVAAILGVVEGLTEFLPRIGFHGHFRIGRERQTLPHTIHQHLHRAAAQQAGRAATDEDRAHFPAIDQR